ncbi:MAG: EamA family transporter [Desulfobacterales bacterium]|nr:EamA family transporter [Desulfobacterales bacterium]
MAGLPLEDKRAAVKAYGAWAAVCLFWGTTYLAIRIGVQVLPPALFAGIRFAIAGLLFAAYLRLRGHPLPGRGELLNIAVVGIALLVIANGLVVWAEQWVPSGLTALIVATVPFWMAGLESLVPSGPRLSARKVLGICVGFSGLLILFAPDLKRAFDAAYFKGILALLVGPFFWTAGSIYSKYRPIRSHPLMAAALQMVVAGAVLILIGAMMGEWGRFRLNFQGTAALLYLILFGSIIGYGSYIYALAKLSATVVSMYAYVNPVIAVLLGWLILGERMDWIVLAAMAFVLAGVLLVKSAKV